MAHAGRTQCVTCSSQRATSSDHIVDDEHVQAGTSLPGPKRRADQPLGTRLAGLRRRVRTVEQAPARHAELAGDGASHELGLVVPAPPHPTGAGGSPGDEVEMVERETAENVWHEHRRGFPAVAELQRQDELAGDTLERQAGDDTRWGSRRPHGGNGEPAPVAQRPNPRPPTSRTTTDEQHVPISTKWVSHGFR